ncbi:DUF308 domain-containing protein [Pseudomonas sp. RIT412]|nr:DUF308 domain-containing protein [Pseudomonas sp. RIT 409]RAU55317.1 DUF308 domain-containing protein [Pseudomonas sp. RIT 412]
MCDVKGEWLVFYYFIRAAVSFIWVGAAVTTGSILPFAAAALIIFYPAWDAAASFLDAYRHGGMNCNPVLSMNAILSLVATIGIAVALSVSTNSMLAVFGIWAIGSGFLQIATAVRRRKKYGAQWLMIMSGAQSAMAGIFFLRQAMSGGFYGVSDIVPYAAFGAFYFLVSGIWLVVSQARQ